MKLFFANLSCREDNFDVGSCKYSLETFYGLENKTKTVERIKNKTFDMFLLDSGAFTFMAQQRKGSKEKTNWYEYLNSYIEFINKHDVEYFLELDIDSIVGYEEVKKMTKILEERTCKKCIPVFHKSRGLEEWERMCKEYDYVAIGTISEFYSNKDVLRYLLKIARSHNTRVHGLGYTQSDVLQFDFYSVDSTSWLAGGRFGSIHLFKNNKMQKCSFRNKRAKDYKQIDEHNFNEWLKYQKHLDRRSSI